MRQADSLYEMIIRGLSTPTPPPSTPSAATLPPPPPPVSTVVVSPECACEPVVNPPCLDAKEEEFIQHIKDWGIGLDAPSEADENELDGYVSEGHFVRIQSNTPSRTPSREHSRPASRGRSNSSAGQGQGSEQGQTRGEIVFPMKAQLEGEDSSKHHSKDSLGVRFAARNAFLTTKKGSEKVAPKVVFSHLFFAHEHFRYNTSDCSCLLLARRRKEMVRGLKQTSCSAPMAETIVSTAPCKPPSLPIPALPQNTSTRLTLAPRILWTCAVSLDRRRQSRHSLIGTENSPGKNSMLSLSSWSYLCQPCCRTLDYVFVTHDWKVESCRVAPTPLLGEEGNVEGRGINAEVRGSQPSEQWPSDHFMIITELAL